jgi:hypothetical protein
MADHLPGPVTAEPQATCDDCVMCPKADGTQPAAAYPFNPRVRCCSYTPILPNFVVGGILTDEHPATRPGQASVRERIAAGVGVTPLGLGHPPAIATLHKASMNAHGRREALRCPHYVLEDSTCGIWRHRNALCATWWCKHERGAAGHQLWNILKELLTAVEQALARWCLLESDFAVGRLPVTLVRSGMEEIGPIDASTLDGRADPATRHMYWGDWAGREEEFFEACAARVAPLTWKEVLDICGPDVHLFAKGLLDAWRAAEVREVPARLRLGTFHLLGVNEQGTTVVTYSPFDPFTIPALLMTALHYFDGRSTEEAFRALAEERGLQLDDALLGALLDYRVLVGGPA